MAFAVLLSRMKPTQDLDSESETNDVVAMAHDLK